MFCKYNFISKREKFNIMEREATACGKGCLDFQAQGYRPLVGEDRPARSREYSLAAGHWPVFRGPPGPGGFVGLHGVSLFRTLQSTSQCGNHYPCRPGGFIVNSFISYKKIFSCFFSI